MFNMVSLDGFFEAPGRDISWHSVDAEFNTFAIEQLNKVDTIIFGRITYELMENYWPTAAAEKDDPEVALLMNASKKIVCSTTMKEAHWSNTRLIGRDVEAELDRLKSGKGKDLIIFGSGVLCASLSKAGMIDEYRIMVSPIVLAGGTQLFRERMNLLLVDSRTFGNGNTLLTYAPARR